MTNEKQQMIGQQILLAHQIQTMNISEEQIREWVDWPEEQLKLFLECSERCSTTKCVDKTVEEISKNYGYLEKVEVNEIRRLCSNYLSFSEKAVKPKDYTLDLSIFKITVQTSQKIMSQTIKEVIKNIDVNPEVISAFYR